VSYGARSEHRILFRDLGRSTRTGWSRRFSNDLHSMSVRAGLTEKFALVNLNFAFNI
jgi:hypothetical protein